MLIDDWGHEYEERVPRAPTEALLEILRREHPEMERGDFRSIDRAPPPPLPRVRIEDVPAAREIGEHLLGVALRDAAVRHGLTVSQLTGRSRSRGVLTMARREAAVALRDRGCSLYRIGQLMCRDHTTVLYHLQRARTDGVRSGSSDRGGL